MSGDFSGLGAFLIATVSIRNAGRCGHAASATACGSKECAADAADMSKLKLRPPKRRTPCGRVRSGAPRGTPGFIVGQPVHRSFVLNELDAILSGSHCRAENRASGRVRPGAGALFRAEFCRALQTSAIASR